MSGVEGLNVSEGQVLTLAPWKVGIVNAAVFVYK